METTTTAPPWTNVSYCEYTVYLDNLLVSSLGVPKHLMSNAQSPALEFIEDYYNELHGLVANCCRKQLHLVDEIFSDVVLEYTDNALATYDATKGQSVKQHVFHTLKFYIAKWFDRPLKSHERLLTFTDIANHTFKNEYEDDSIDKVNEIKNTFADKELPSHESAIIDKEQVQIIMESLSAYDKNLLYLRFVLEWTYEEIANELGCVINTAKTHCIKALSRAKLIANGLQWESIILPMIIAIGGELSNARDTESNSGTT